jgi:ribosomal protein L24
MPKLTKIILTTLIIISLKTQTVANGINSNWVSGEITAIKNGSTISLKTVDGNIDVFLTDTTVFKKVSPENPKLTAAIDSNLSEISEGDKILVTGTVSGDKKSISAQTIYLVTKSDLAQKRTVERDLWRTRGVSGKVVSIDYKTQNITLAVRNPQGESKIILSPKENVQYLRYAPDSVKFADAVVSNLAEIKVGDQLRALGERSADGLSFQAEKYISGSFKMVAGKITALDLARNEVTITDSQSKKTIVAQFNKNTLLKKFPPEIAQMMMLQIQAERAQPQNTNRVRRDFDEMLERLPNLKLSELNINDSIGISCIVGTSPNLYTAVKLLAGVEPFLNPPRTNGTSGNNNAQSQPITIPGLDDIEN